MQPSQHPEGEGEGPDVPVEEVSKRFSTKLFNENPIGKVLKEERLRALMGDGGIHDCAYAQNCVNACPKEIPLTRAISDVGRDVMVQAIKDVFTR